MVIIGAGLAGLVAAEALSAAGRTSIVLDKGRAPGGRLATRRMPGLGGVAARLDHGAQFFTVRSPVFADMVARWSDAGLVREWCRGFGAVGDGHPRYAGDAGMTTIAKHLASNAHVECDALVHSVGVESSGTIVVALSDGVVVRSDSVIITPPVPQSLSLADAGALPIPAATRQQLEQVSYAPCLALLVTLDRAPAVPAPGGVQLGVDDDPWFSFVADNHAKGISDVPAVTLHVHDEPSLRLWDTDPELVTAQLLEGASRWLGPAAVVSCELKKWRYARPLVGHPDACVPVGLGGGAVAVFAGDAFGGAKVEGAALSGLAAVHQVLAAGW